MYNDETLYVKSFKSFKVGPMMKVAVETCKQALNKFAYGKQSSFVDVRILLLWNYPGYAVGCFAGSTTGLMINGYLL